MIWTLQVDVLSKKEKGLMDMTTVWWLLGGSGIRGLNGNRKNAIKIKVKKIKLTFSHKNNGSCRKREWMTFLKSWWVQGWNAKM